MAYSECDDLTTEIASYLHGKGCYILVIYGGATAESVATKAQGETVANDIVAAANNLGVPAGGCLFHDVEPGWQVISEHTDGYWTTMHNSQREVPGFYADTRTDSAIQNYYFNTAYCTVRSQKLGQDCHVWSQWPKVSLFWRRSTVFVCDTNPSLPRIVPIFPRRDPIRPGQKLCVTVPARWTVRRKRRVSSGHPPMEVSFRFATHQQCLLTPQCRKRFSDQLIG